MQTSLPTRLTLSRAQQPVILGGVPVRTNLRAGIAWDDLDDKAKELWGKLTSAVSNATNTLTPGNNASQPK